MKNSSSPAAALLAYDLWLNQVGVTPTTGWRWRKNGWLSVTNISGRIYLSGEQIAAFTARATSGEFAKVHKTPARQTAATLN